MSFFKCRGCEAKDSEIAHLMAQLDRLQGMIELGQKRLAELAEPGISLRLAGAARSEKQPVDPSRPNSRPPRRMVPGFPGYGPEPARPAVEIDE